ncbi:hypothetical protein HOK021_65860 [Streptomyces hygroscopicus]|nr:hypothetical protein HOK021_65860 [Streptomyces hygroscopicus]
MKGMASYESRKWGSGKRGAQLRPRTVGRAPWRGAGAAKAVISRRTDTLLWRQAVSVTSSWVRVSRIVPVKRSAAIEA